MKNNNKSIWNGKYVESVHIFDKEESKMKFVPACKKYSWKWFYSNMPEGYYYNGYASPILAVKSADDLISKGLFIENNIAYNKPYVKIKFTSGDSKIKRFESIVLANGYYNKIEACIALAHQIK